jgi:hypothetical protein
MADTRLRDISTFLNDGICDPAPCQVWVSDDDGCLDAYVSALARSINDGTALADFAGRGLRGTTAEILLARTAGIDAATFVRSLTGDLAELDTTLVIRAVDRLLDDRDGRVVLDGLLDATRDGRLGGLLTLTGSPGLDRLRAEAPRLPGLATILLLDTSPPHTLDLRCLLVTESRDDPAERGWVVVVRCRLAAPAPGLSTLQPGAEIPRDGFFDGRLVDRMWLVHGEDGPAALMVSVTPTAVGAGDRGLAAEIAVAAARAAVGRPLRENECLAAVRQIHYG